ncbi:MAG: hypothetical protein LBO82_04180, partial [Synergistaceae bacterium]|nr:hypothetical protein [Synergistaceae bacterium]
MSKFGMFSKKNAQKIGLGLLVLSLLLAAAPRARASFDVTGVSPSSIMKYEDDILYIELGKDSDVIIRNESNTNDTTRKGIVISLDAGTDENSPAKLTLQNLTVSSDAEGAAFLLGGASEGCAITIEIKDAVTLSGDSAGLLASYDLHNRANDLHLVLSADQGAEFKAIGGGNGLSADARYAVTLQGEGSFDFTGSGSGNGAIFVPAFYFQESGGLQGHRREFTLKGNVAVRAAGLEGASGIKAARLSMKENAKLYARGGDSDDDAGGSGIDVENLEMQGSAAIESARGGNGGSSGGDGIKVTGTLTSQQEVLNFDGTEIRDAKGGDGSAPGNGICFAPKHPLKFYFQLFGFIDAQAGNALEEGIGAHAFAFRYGADESDICEIRSADVQVAVPDGTLPGSYMLSVILPSANSLILPNDDETSAAFLKFMNTATNLEGKGTVWFPVLSDVNVKAAAYRYSATQELLASTDCLPDGGISIPVSGSDSFLNMDISFDSKVLNGESYKYTYIVKLGGAGSTFITPTSDADGIRYFIELSADAGIEIDSEINPGAEILILDSETAASPQVTALKKRGSNAPAADDNARYGLLGLLVPKEASSALDKDGANFGVRIRASGSDISGIISSMLCGTLRLWGEPGEPQNGEGGGGGGGWQPSPTPPVPPSDLPLPPDTPSGPAGVSVTTEDGTTLEAQKQPDGTYLIVVPGG